MSNGTALALRPAAEHNALTPMDFSREKCELLKRTICVGSTDDELELFIHACKRSGLDPFMRQIYAIKRYQEGRGEVMTIQTGIDGYRLIADRTERYVPGREPTFEYNATGELVKATAFVMKQDKAGHWHEVAASAFFDEYAGTKKDGSPTMMWRTKAHIMLSKCAEALALRRAFPAELSGIYTKEEMDQADAEGAPPAAPRLKPPIPLVTDQSALDALNTFRADLNDVFTGRGFAVHEAFAATAKALKGYKVESLDKLSESQRAGLIVWIQQGKADVFKASPPVNTPTAPTEESEAPDPSDKRVFVPDDAGGDWIEELAASNAPDGMKAADAVARIKTKCPKAWPKMSLDARQDLADAIVSGDFWK